MSETITTPFDAAIETLRERERQHDIDAQLAITRRDEVRDMIAVLTSRKPRAPRKPRAVSDVSRDQPDAVPETVADARPPLFSVVPAVERDVVEGAA